ncbi:hypothetical protein ACBC28_004981 [Salmonella enterica]
MTPKLRALIEEYERNNADPELYRACRMLERMQEIESKGGRSSDVLAKWISEHVVEKMLTDGDE